MKQTLQKEQSCTWIIEALYALLEKRHFQDITITDITEKAGVSRLTYYRNFDSKEDIIIRFHESVFEQFLNKIDLLEKKTDLRALIILCFSFFEEHRTRTLFLIRDNLTYLLVNQFSDYIRQALDKMALQNSLTPFQSKFVEGGLYFALISWCENNMDYTKEEIADELIRLLSKSNNASDKNFQPASYH